MLPSARHPWASCHPGDAMVRRGGIRPVVRPRAPRARRRAARQISPSWPASLWRGAPISVVRAVGVLRGARNRPDTRW